MLQLFASLVGLFIALPTLLFMLLFLFSLLSRCQFHKQDSKEQSAREKFSGKLFSYDFPVVVNFMKLPLNL